MATPQGVPNPDTDWQTDTGLPDDFDFWITHAYFGFLAEYVDQDGSPQPLLIWQGSSPTAEIDHVAFSLGKGWVPGRDGGRTVTHEKGRAKFIETSRMGRLIKRMGELNVLPLLKQRGSDKDAQVWVGLGFHMKRETVTYPGLSKSEHVHLYPTKFLGQQGTPAPAPAPAPGSTPTPALASTPAPAIVPPTIAPPATPPASAPVGGEPLAAAKAEFPTVSDALLTTILGLAKSAPTYESFVQAVYPQLNMTDPNLAGLIKSVFDASGFYAKYKG